VSRLLAPPGSNPDDEAAPRLDHPDAALAERPGFAGTRSVGGLGGAALAEGPDSLRARSVGGLGGASRAPHV